jgi:glycerol-3-phosphate dehydrogenase
MDKTTFDVVIIGAGISGACIARELSKTSARICLVDKEDDVSCGTSKANSGIIHAGYDPLPGTLMAKYNVRGAAMYPELAKKLHFDYNPLGSLVLAFDDNGVAKIKTLLERGKKNGVKELRIVEQEELRSLEPNINENAVAALFAPTAGIIAPYQTTWAFAESAVINGVSFLRNTMVHSIKKNDDNIFVLETSSGELKCHFVVNAAGLAADKVSKLAGARDYTIVQRRGEYCLLDNKCKNLVNHVLFQTPGPLGKGVLVTQSVDGNILIGPSADDVTPATMDYTGTTALSQDAVLKAAARSVTDIPRRNIINSFAGIRALAYEKGKDGTLTPIDDFIIEEDKQVHGFINVGGICSPGLTSAPAIAEGVVELLKKAGLKVEANKHFIEEREGITSFKNADHETKVALIKKDARYGQIICRCEMITEGEIVAAIHSPLGAIDLDGVKRRTRAGMGRCQAGFCSPRVTEILSRELGIPMVNVTKRGGTSYVLDSKTRATVSDVAAVQNTSAQNNEANSNATTSKQGDAK